MEVKSSAKFHSQRISEPFERNQEWSLRHVAEISLCKYPDKTNVDNSDFIAIVLLGSHGKIQQLSALYCR